MKKLIILSLVLFSCTENTRAKRWGGSQTIELPPNVKLMEVTWKEGNMWYLTEPMDSSYIPKTKIFQEKSGFGVMEGNVTFVETR